ncbi:sensor histidine kinase [Pseudactinotalea suaedae]|uniref:sensor histidine kinase n=1 Tax=Pseudactinotalea suaedae TaxID=1524924 RepID=UPI0012E16224|nr:histidine kinase [Pseudactinotalea suaedae]
MTRRLGQTMAIALHLAALGLAGPIAVALLGSAIGIGIGGLFALGLGVFALAAAALGIWWIAWFEEQRVASLLGLDIPVRRMPRSPRTDWLRIPHTLWLQVTDRTNLRSLLHFVIIGLLGLVTLGLLQVTFTGAAFGIASALTSAEVYAAPWFGLETGRGTAIGIGFAGMLIGAVGVYLMTLAHRSISPSLMVPSREAELTQRAETATQRRHEAMRAAEVERTRIERDLHDGVQPRLVSVGMTLGMARSKLASDPEAAAALIDEAHTSTKAAITELRQLARGIHPAVLSDRGLDAALSALAARSHIPVHLDVQLDGRCSREVEAAMYFAVAEALTNAAKHSEARTCRVTIMRRPGGNIWARIEDDGNGGARRVPGGGIDGVANRVAAAGGALSLTSPAGGPTTIEASLPCAS